MSLTEDPQIESAVEAMRAESEERMAAALEARKAGSVVTFEVTRQFYSDINGAVGETKRVAPDFYRRLLATVQPWAPAGPPEFWKVLDAPAATVEPDAPIGPPETFPAPVGGDLPGAPPESPTFEDVEPPAPAPVPKSDPPPAKPPKEAKK